MQMLNSSAPERKYQVFISSPFADLRPLRQQVLDVIVDRGHIPVALERAGAANESVPDVVKRAVQNCQLYILILGHRYGSLTPGGDKSFTELEYDFAVENGLTVLPFVMDLDDADKWRHSLYGEQTKIAKEERENENKYLRFRNRVTNAEKHYCGFFRRRDKDIRYLVAKSFEKAEQDCELPAWVRETGNVDSDGRWGTAQYQYPDASGYAVDVVEMSERNLRAIKSGLDS